MTHIHASASHSLPRKREEEYLAGWKRARAELLNFRKQQGQETQAARARLTQDVLESFIDVAENMRALIAHQPPEVAGSPWAQGVVHVARQFDQVLQSYGIKILDEASGPFDPKLHEAVGEEAAEGIESGHVAAIVQPGYALGERVLRPAKVKVAL